MHLDSRMHPLHAERLRRFDWRAIAPALLALFVSAWLLRAARLAWQPLWWDEGYSIYFATEPLARMLWLTSHDIHPPLYYALLHGWSLLTGGLTPQTSRLLSVLIGSLAIPSMAWAAALFFPRQWRVLTYSILLMLLNPMHLFYSQEVRMYGLAMVLGLLATACFWSAVQRIDQRIDPTWTLAWYVVFTTLSLYTLYYCALLVASHLCFAIWHYRGRLGNLRIWLVVWLISAAAYAPWLIYALPKLVGYVAQKVVSDADRPLSAGAYLWRHLWAFAAGHISSESVVLQAFGLAGVIGLTVGLVLATRIFVRRRAVVIFAGDFAQIESPATVTALWVFLLIPVLGAFALNLRLPFFPDGGERLLLITLPFLLLLLATACARTGAFGAAVLSCVLVANVAGMVIFYTAPRYTDEDYRGLLQQVIEQSRDDDTLLAIFPWQVGYWRAYAPPDLAGPQPLLLGDKAVVYGVDVEAAIDRGLARGAIWFPEPLAFGSTLPSAVEEYLRQHAANLDNRWISATTRLTAWRVLPAASNTGGSVDYGAIRLTGAGVGAAAVTSDNTPIAVALTWSNPISAAQLAVTLRLVDGEGRTWASRSYAPPGAFAAPNAGDSRTDHIGLIAAVGTPPGVYTVTLAVEDQSDGAQLAGRTARQADLYDAPLGVVHVLAPTLPVAVERMPLTTRIKPDQVADGFAVIGFSAPPGGSSMLAGAELQITLGLQKRTATQAARGVYVSLRTKDGISVAGWEGWPLPAYPTTTWSQGALVRVPIRFDLPATLTTQEYRLVAGLLGPTNGVKSSPLDLGTIRITQREARFVADTPPHSIDPPAQFGSHAFLYGYALTLSEQAIELELYWKLTQTLLPRHNIFVHLDTAEGVTVAQSDSAPTTAAGAAPSGSWLPGEYLVTQHTLARPPGEELRIRVGLYNPVTGVRLPVSSAGQPVGDAVTVATMP